MEKIPCTARRLEPELLDSLPADDPRAQRARRDLRRINWWMRNAAQFARKLPTLAPRGKSLRLVEIGAGDGTLMLRVAERLGRLWPRVELQLIDRQHLLAPEVVKKFQALGWTVTAVQAEVEDWLSKAAPVDLAVANLFLHHFDDVELGALFSKLATVSAAFAACETRRFAFPGLAGRLVWLIGANSVTRYDAVASVRAGFRGRELAALWPVQAGWQLEENEAGLFSHWFSAKRLPP